MNFTRSICMFNSLLILVVGIGPVTVYAAAFDDCPADGTLISHGTTLQCQTANVVTETHEIEYNVGGTGGTNLTSTNLSINEWPAELAPGRPVGDGVSVLARYEHDIHINDSIVANTSLAAQPRYVDFNGAHKWTGGAVHLLEYQLKLTPQMSMNGVSRMILRSPVAWTENWTMHFIEIRTLDANGNEVQLITAARYYPGATNSLDTTDGVLKDGRLYYELNGLFTSNVTYTIDEYAQMRNVGGTDLAQQGLRVYVAEGQDIGGDGLANFRLFPGHGASQRIFTQDLTENRTAQFAELGWSARLTDGMGTGGTVGLLVSRDGAQNEQVNARYVPADPHLNSGTADTDTVQIMMPLKLSKPVNAVVTVVPFSTYADRTVMITSGGSTRQGWQAGTAVTYTTPTPITGMMDLQIHLSSNTIWNASTQHYYDIEVTFSMPTDSDCADLSKCAVISYPMSTQVLPDATRSFHLVTQTGTTGGVSWSNTRAVYAAPWLEVNELHTGTWTQNSGQDSTSFWGGAASTLIGAVSILGGIAVIVGDVALLAGACTIGAVATLGATCLLALATVPIALAVAGGLFTLGYVGVRDGLAGQPPSVVFSADRINDIIKGAGKILAISACSELAIASIAGVGGKSIGGLALKSALAVECAGGALIASGGIEGLLKFLYDLVHIVEKAVELGGLLLSKLADYAVMFLDNAEGWVKAAYIAFSALTFLWAIREGLLWIMNMLWPMTSIMAPNARRHHQRFESIIENVSVPLWDAIMAKWWGAYRGRYLRQRRGGNPD